MASNKDPLEKANDESWVEMYVKKSDGPSSYGRVAVWVLGGWEFLQNPLLVRKGHVVKCSGNLGIE